MVDPIDDLIDIREHLYCLFLVRIGRYVILAEIARKAFINTASNGEWLSRTANLIEKLRQEEQERQNQAAKQLAKNIFKGNESQYILELGQWEKRKLF